MKSLIVKRSVAMADHKTSISLEDAFWKMLKEIAVCRNMALSDLVASIDNDRCHTNLSSAIRLFVLESCKIAAHTGSALPAQPLMQTSSSTVG
jgi:predicted DNA-binding ribbon-helix-helix protein